MRPIHWSDWPLLGLCVVVLALFIDSSNGLMRVRNELLDFGTALTIIETAPFLLLVWVPLRFAAREYSPLPPLLGVAAWLLAVLTFASIAAQAAAGS